MNDLSAKRELYDQAKEFKDNPAFVYAMERIKKELDGELILADTTEKKLDLISQLKMHDRLQRELGAIMEDYKQAVRRQHG